MTEEPQAGRCLAAECDRYAKARGLCYRHYSQARDRGELDGYARKPVPSTEARFWAFVEKTDTCWLWRGHVSRGYGRFRDGRQVMAHRFAYELMIGPIPDGLQLDHLCRVRNCVNPAHLEPVTARENTLRGVAPSAIRAQQTHCIHGHEFTPENTKIEVTGWRSCRTCKREIYRRKRLRRKERAL